MTVEGEAAGSGGNGRSNGSGNGAGLGRVNTVPWRAGAGFVGGGATGAGLMALAVRAEPTAFLGGLFAWSLVTLGTVIGGAVSLWATRRIVHADELAVALTRERERVAELQAERRRREEELIGERRAHEAEMRAAWQTRERELVERSETWEQRFWAQSGIMTASTEQSAQLAQAAGSLIARTAQIMPLEPRGSEGAHERARPGTGDRGSGAEPESSTG